MKIFVFCVVVGLLMSGCLFNPSGSLDGEADAAGDGDINPDATPDASVDAPIDAPPPLVASITTELSLVDASNVHANLSTLIRFQALARMCVATTDEPGNLDWNETFPSTDGVVMVEKMVAPPVGSITYTITCMGDVGPAAVSALIVNAIDVPVQAYAGVPFNFHYRAEGLAAGNFCALSGGGFVGAYPAPENTVQATCTSVGAVITYTVNCNDGVRTYLANTKISCLQPI
jgi:hypothetical protein